jgi:hypothetical protein
LEDIGDFSKKNFLAEIEFHEIDSRWKSTTARAAATSANISSESLFLARNELDTSPAQARQLKGVFTQSDRLL